MVSSNGEGLHIAVAPAFETKGKMWVEGQSMDPSSGSDPLTPGEYLCVGVLL